MWVCGGSLDGNADSNLAWVMGVFLWRFSNAFK
jgi:hypothetical protein